MINVSGGSLTYAGGGLVANWGGSANAQIAVINVSGTGSIATTNNSPIAFNNNGANTGVLNLNGGTVTTSQVNGGRGFLNFNGGTLKPSIATTNFLAVNTARIHAGGAVIDTDGKDITIGQALLAPTGQGITEIPVADGGSGYTCPPIVTIGTGGGTDATAVANMVDDGTGNGTFKIASLTLTSPGSYSSTTIPITLTGGGATTPATFRPGGPGRQYLRRSHEKRRSARSPSPPATPTPAAPRSTPARSSFPAAPPPSAAATSPSPPARCARCKTRMARWPMARRFI